MDLSRVDSEEDSRYLSYTRLKAHDSLSGFLQEVLYPHAPWTQFQNVTWVTNELYPFLLELLPRVREAWTTAWGEAYSGLPAMFVDAVPRETSHPSDDVEKVIMLLCSIFQGIAASWVSLNSEDTLPLDRSVRDPAELEDNNCEYDAHLAEKQSTSLKKDAYVPATQGFSSNGNSTLALECLGLVIETLSCGLISNVRRRSFVLDHTNDGLLFFEALLLADPRTQYYILIVLEQILGGSHTGSTAPTRNQPADHLYPSPLDPYTSDMVNERLCNVLVASPHAIENIMMVVEQEDALTVQPEFVKGQCLLVLKLLLSSRGHEHLKLIMTFQSLPDLLVRTLQHEISDPHNVVHDADISLEGLNVLSCLISLMETAAARKYMLQTSLLDQVFQCLSQYLAAHTEASTTNGLWSFVSLLSTFLMGSPEDEYNFAMRQDALSATQRIETLFCAFLFLFQCPATLYQMGTAHHLIALTSTASEPFLFALLDVSDSRYSAISLHRFISDLFHRGVPVAQRSFLLVTLQQIFYKFPALRIHAVSVGWTVDSSSTLQPFGLSIEKAFLTCLSTHKHQPQTTLLPTGSESVPLFLSNEDDSEGSEDHVTHDVHVDVWMAGSLLITLFYSTLAAAEKAFNIMVKNDSTRDTRTLSELVTDVLCSLLEQLQHGHFLHTALLPPRLVHTSDTHDLQLNMSPITSMIILLQLVFVWCNEASTVCRRWLENATFVPFILALCLCVFSYTGDKPRLCFVECVSLSNESDTSLLPPWCIIVRSLAIGIVALLLKDKSLSANLLIALQRRFTLRELSKDFRRIFSITGLPMFCDASVLLVKHDNADPSSLVTTLIHPLLTQKLHTLRDVIEPTFVQAYLATETTKNNATEPSPYATHTLNTVAPSNTCYASNDTETLYGSSLLLTELRILREQVEALVQEQLQRQHTMEQERHKYATHITILNNQLSALVLAYEQLLSQVKTNTFVSPAPSVSSESPSVSSNLRGDNQLETLTELLGILIKTFPDVKYFIDHFHLPQHPGSSGYLPTSPQHFPERLS